MAVRRGKRLSVIIPAFNEEAHIGATLGSVGKGDRELEVIVVDGGSSDRTAAISRGIGARVEAAPRGRAKQLNAGAEAAHGDILLFLHADTRLPPGYRGMVDQVLAEDEVAAGAFRLAVDSNRKSIAVITWAANLRSRVLQFPYGDQAIFMKAVTFDRLGGFAEIPIMEDFELVRRLRQLGSLRLVREPVVTSGRRWRTKGVLRTTLINQLMVVGFLVGIPSQFLAKLYGSGKGR